MLMSDNSFITAHIGGGKSLLGTRVICNELETTERTVSTSLPLFVDDHWMVVPRTKRLSIPAGIPSWWYPEFKVREVDGKPDTMEIWVYGLATWCHYEIKKPVNLNDRLRLLQHEEVSKFYLHYPNVDLPEEIETLPGRKPVAYPRLDLRKGDGGCLFVIDEIHNYFSARNYLEAGPGVERYQSQLRKMNDDMFMISQHLEKVDKNFRRNATKTYELHNMGNHRLWGGVTLKERFSWKQYSGIPQRGDRNVDKGHFFLRERGMCFLYDTMSGAGVSGGIVPDKPSKGRHWTTWLWIVLVISVIGFFFPRLAMKGFGMGVGGLLNSVTGGVSKSFHPSVFKPVPVSYDHVLPGVRTVQPESKSFISNRGASLPLVSDQNSPYQVFCTGYIVLPGKGAIAFLSNGQQLHDEIVQVRPDMIVTRHGFYRFETSQPVFSSVVQQSSPAPDFGFYIPSPNVATSGSAVSVTVIGQSYRDSIPHAHSSGFSSSSYASEQQLRPTSQNLDTPFDE